MFKQDKEDRKAYEELAARTGEAAEFYRPPFGQDNDENLDYEAEVYEDEEDEGPFESLLRMPGLASGGTAVICRDNCP
jgi:hypothetical protein